MEGVEFKALWDRVFKIFWKFTCLCLGISYVIIMCCSYQTLVQR